LNQQYSEFSSTREVERLSPNTSKNKKTVFSTIFEKLLAELEILCVYQEPSKPIIFYQPPCPEFA